MVTKPSCVEVGPIPHRGAFDAGVALDAGTALTMTVVHELKTYASELGLS